MSRFTWSIIFRDCSLLFNFPIQINVDHIMAFQRSRSPRRRILSNSNIFACVQNLVHGQDLSIFHHFRIVNFLVFQLYVTWQFSMKDSLGILTTNLSHLIDMTRTISTLRSHNFWLVTQIFVFLNSLTCP